MSLNDIVNVSIEKQTAAVSRVGYGTPLIMSTEATGLLTTTAKIYDADPADLAADGFDVDGVTYKKFSALCSQNPKVSRIVIGKRANKPTKTVEITPIAKNLTDYIVTINGTEFKYTSDGTAIVAEITLGLTTLINAGLENVKATDGTTKLTIESAATPGGIVTADTPYHLLVNDRTLLAVQNTTADPGIVADLTAVRTSVDGNDDWYAVILDNSGKAEILALAAHIETLLKIFIASTSDTDVLTASTTDVGYTLQSLNYARSAYVWHHNPDNGPEAAWLGRALPYDPGSITWNLLSNISGVPASDFSTAELGYLVGKNGNRFVILAGLTAPQEGKMAGGEFIDVTRGLDWVVSTIKENVFRQLYLLPKIPFTDQGVAVIENEVRGVMNQAVAQSVFTADPEPVVSVPLVADTDPNDRANRLLTPVNFSAQLAGAIHSIEVFGTVTV